MLSTNATLRDAQQFVDAVQNAGGRTPTVLANIPLAGHDLLASQGAPTDPAMAIVEAARNGELTAYRRDALINEAALLSMRAVYLGDLKRRIEPLLVRAFHQAATVLLIGRRCGCRGASDRQVALQS